VEDSSTLGLEPLECPDCGVTTYRVVGMGMKKTRISDEVVEMAPVLELRCAREEHPFFRVGVPQAIRLPIELDEPNSDERAFSPGPLGTRDHG